MHVPTQSTDWQWPYCFLSLPCSSRSPLQWVRSLSFQCEAFYNSSPRKPLIRARIWWRWTFLQCMMNITTIPSLAWPIHNQPTLDTTIHATGWTFRSSQLLRALPSNGLRRKPPKSKLIDLFSCHPGPGSWSCYFILYLSASQDHTEEWQNGWRYGTRICPGHP